MLEAGSTGGFMGGWGGGVVRGKAFFRVSKEINFILFSYGNTSLLM